MKCLDSFKLPSHLFSTQTCETTLEIPLCIIWGEHWQHGKNGYVYIVQPSKEARFAKHIALTSAWIICFSFSSLTWSNGSKSGIFSGIPLNPKETNLVPSVITDPTFVDGSLDHVDISLHNFRYLLSHFSCLVFCLLLICIPYWVMSLAGLEPALDGF